MAVIDSTAQRELREITGHLEELVDLNGPKPSGAVETAEVAGQSWFCDVEDAVLDLVNTLPEGAHDREALQLFSFLIDLRRVLAEQEATKEPAQVELAAMRVGDVARRLERRLEQDALEVPENAAQFVFEHLDAVDTTDQARLLGVSTKTLGAWKRGAPVRQNKDRVRLVAQLIGYLTRSMTQTGLLMWFDNEVDQLGGVTPLALINAGEAAAWERLLGFARGGRAQLAG